MTWSLIAGRKKEEGDRFRAFFESAPDAMVVVDTKGSIVLVNARCERLFGYDRTELLGKKVEFLIPEGFRERHVPQRAEYLADPEMRRMMEGGELRGITKGGGELALEVTMNKVQTGEEPLVCAALREATGKKETSRNARGVVEAMADPLALVTPEGKIAEVNEAMVAVTGIPRGDLVGSPFASLCTDPEKASSDYRRIMEKGGERDWSLSIRHREGRVTEVRVNASLFRDASGTPVGMVAVARDVSEQNAMMREFAEAKNYLDNILQSSTKYSIVGMDLNRRIISWNEGGRRNYGYTPDQIVGKGLEVLHTPEDMASGAVDRLIDVAHDKGVAEGEFTRVRRDGSHFEASVVVTRRNDLAGRPIGYLLMSSDISDRKQAEARLRQSAQYGRTLIEASVDPLVTISPEGKITDVNEATARATGVPREHLVGTDFATYCTDPEKARAGYREAFDKGFVTDYPLSLRHRDGAIMEVLMNVSVYRGVGGEVLGVFVVARDVTQRRRLDAELIEAANILAASSGEIMASITQVASGATETAATVTETTSIAEEVKMAAQLSAQKARGVLDVAQKSVAVAETGRKAVENTVTGMGRIQEEMTSIAESITRFSEQSQTIGEIIDTVQDFAEQSNLLAVNAAIEAAKAGEHGAGFAVVAQEVKSLAEQSKGATTQVRSILAEVQKATNAAVSATNQGRQGVELGVRQSQEAGEAISQMAEEIEGASKSAMQIVASSQEHLTGMDQIVQGMENIKQASEQNVTGMKQVEETLHNLHELGQKLKLLVDQYKA